MTSKMLSETNQSSEVIERQWLENTAQRLKISKVWQKKNYYSFITVARGSSDHAAQYFNYLVGLELGKLTTSFTPSLITTYQKHPQVNQSATIAISQSGKSPDLITSVDVLKQSNSDCFGLINSEDSPLAKNSDFLYPLKAGVEESVAATKSYIATLFASCSLIATTSKNQDLLDALTNLSTTLNNSDITSWDRLKSILSKSKQAMVVGRGLGFSIALEAALKLKETCHIQAEAFSAAEILHGPQAVIESGYPLIVFALRGPTQKGLLNLASQMKSRGANVVVITDKAQNKDDCLYNTAPHEYLDGISAIKHFYLVCEEIARLKGLDPDNPRSLSKVTMTF